ncbi:DUF4902 domain-containing protein [Paraburkholderia azotifigens]
MQQPNLLRSTSPDGYIRLSEHALARLQLVHSVSCIDNELLDELRANAFDALCAGYTEWQSTRFPGSVAVSIGWDWYLDRTSGALLVVGPDVRSNIMVVDVLGEDVGMAGTSRIIVRRLATMSWSRAVEHAAFPCAPVLNAPMLH